MPFLLPLLLVAIVACACPRCDADTITIPPSGDTCLWENAPDSNWGAQSEIVSGVLGDNEGNPLSRALLKFDIAASIPAGSTITAAELTMTATKTPPGAPATEFHLLRVLASWSEGAGSSASPPGGATASAGETTWSHRFHPATEWTLPGGKAEVDFAEDPSSIHIVSGNSSDRPVTNLENIFVFNAEGVSDLNSMLNFPPNDFGWVLIPDDETVVLTARRWAAREHTELAPELKITFTPPPGSAPPEIIDAYFEPESGDLAVEFHSEAGAIYTLETRSDLDSGDWGVAVADIAGVDGSVTVTTTPPPGEDRLFFRVIRQ